ncbi:hypothetical protein P618_200367 [Holospora obtusa F1]|uniref:Uncharacterized protein n=1 Tax=Holospora obtusa F1 TaxID=1399147 RepID=W6TE65_HOLOB|nr:hypothetical protein [Holospora obtusa]ETZ07438.1 hypothetical protein P618_200367 [Holospora obtusa F1]
MIDAIQCEPINTAQINTVWAHQHSVGSKKKSIIKPLDLPLWGSTKIHAPCDAYRNSVSIHLHKVRTMIWNGGDALMGHFVKADAVFFDKAVRCR